MYRFASVATLAILAAISPPIRGHAADLTILSPGATEGVLGELLPQFEKSTGIKTSIAYGPAGSVAARVKMGENIDVVISSEPEAESLRAEGKSVAGNHTIVAKVGVGMFVRKGDPKPDVATADAFIRALADAKVIAYADPALGGSASILVAQLLNSLDASGAIAAKSKLLPPAKPLVDFVAAGGVDLAFQPIAQIFLDPRIEYVGPIPAPHQRYTQYVASLVTTSARPEQFKALMTFLSSPATLEVWKARGFEPR